MYDMHGNVWEWTSTKLGSDRLFCGGSWYSYGVNCKALARVRLDPDYRRSNDLGFRLLAVPDGE